RIEKLGRVTSDGLRHTPPVVPYNRWSGKHRITRGHDKYRSADRVEPPRAELPAQLAMRGRSPGAAGIREVDRRSARPSRRAVARREKNSFAATASRRGKKPRAANGRASRRGRRRPDRLPYPL